MKMTKCSYRSMYLRLMIIVLVQHGLVQGQVLQPGGQILPLSVGAYRKENNSAFTAALRPAAGNFIPKKLISLYAENRFMLRKFSDMQVAVNIPVHSILLSFSGHYRGIRLLSTQSIGAGIGMKLSSKLSMGIKFSGQSLTVSSFANVYSLVAEGGMIHSINDKVSWGTHIRHGTFLNTTHKTARGQTQIIAGIGYTLNKQLFVAYEISASSLRELGVTAVVDWWATDNIYFRGGINKPINNFFFAAGNKGKRETISIGLSTHAVLGYSGALLFEYALQ